MTKATFVFDQQGSVCMSTLDVLHAGVSEASAAAALSVFMKDAWMVYASQQVDLVEVRLGETVHLVTDGDGQGELTACPSSCALIMQKNTSTNVRGRFMLPGISEADVSANGTVNSELRGLLNVSFAAARSALLDDGVGCYVVSGVGAGASYAVNSFTARPLIATLRNRLIGR